MKTFSNDAGTTSSEFAIGTGTTGCRQIALGAVCAGTDTDATDRNGNNITIAGTEFFDLKFLATNQVGAKLTKQFRGTVTDTGSINKVEDTFEDVFDGNVELSVASSQLVVSCKIGSATSATYNVYVTLQRIE